MFRHLILYVLSSSDVGDAPDTTSASGAETTVADMHTKGALTTRPKSGIVGFVKK